ncbi:hypothetical protein GCM10007968_23780 [Sporolactobacillus putidus]|uniref:Uncharacterized protein n=1 Tax=Sporolactobacillus putidus TaxID=492735 RepID=A0A917S6S0_9BACL|nr:hypothetical protein GCM10007968_23780 [Sporolactobacillus putidus]
MIGIIQMPPDGRADPLFIKNRERENKKGEEYPPYQTAVRDELKKKKDHGSL